METTFNPLNEARTKRVNIDLDQVETVSGSLNVRKAGRKAVVKILDKVYEVVGISCGLPGCNCDAYMKEIA